MFRPLDLFYEYFSSMPTFYIFDLNFPIFCLKSECYACDVYDGMIYSTCLIALFDWPWITWQTITFSNKTSSNKESK